MTAARRLRFDRFELLPETGELFRDGERIPLQHQPAQLLALLARHPGEAISRQEIRDEIWGRETFVDHDQSINYCVRQIRQALGDDPAAPRYVETVPRHGYRFVAPVAESDAEPAGTATAAGSEPAAVPASSGRSGRRAALRAAVLVLAVAGLVALVTVVAAWLATGPARRGGAEGAAAPSRTGEPPTQVVVPEEARFRFLKARYLLERATPEEHVDAATEAIELLEAVVAEVPRYGEAHAVLADAWMLRFDLPRNEAMERAGAAARRALAIDPGLPLAHTVLAATLLFHRLDWAGAEEHLDRALELDPESPDAVFLSAILASTLGRHEQAIANARRAATLEPGQLPGLSIAWFYYFAGRFDEAVVEAERVLELAPADEPSHQVLVLSHLAAGDEPAADAEIDRYYGHLYGVPEGQDPGMPTARELYAAWWQNRDRDAPGTLSPMVQATHAVLSGEDDGAIELLLIACRDRLATWDIPFVAVDPRWDPLRAREDFAEVLECVGVPGNRGWRLDGLEG